MLNTEGVSITERPYILGLSLPKQLLERACTLSSCYGLNHTILSKLPTDDSGVELVYLGDGDPESVFPFRSADTTPRKWRSASDWRGRSRDIDVVISSVSNLDSASERPRARELDY